MKKTIKITKILLLVITSVIIVYDVVVKALGYDEATVSNITYWSGLRLVFVPYVWGVITAHFWLSKIGGKLFGFKKWRYFVWIPISVLFLVFTLIGSVDGSHLTNLSLYFGQNLWIPLLLGECMGLLWAQEKPKMEVVG